MTSQAVLLLVTCDAASKPATSFISVIKRPSSLMNSHEGNTAPLMARKAFLTLMATVTHILISYGVDAM